MKISGTGIGAGTAIDVAVLKGFKPNTRLALTWTEASDGTYIATDRGFASDTYDTDIKVYGYLSDINNLVDAIQQNRAANSNVITLSWLHSDEHIFGEDVDHTTNINAVVLDYGVITQGSWGGFGVALKLRALSPALIGTSSLPTLKYLSYGYIADSSVTVNKYDTYGGTYAYADRLADAGRFEGVFTFSIVDMRNLRAYLRSTRGASFTVTDIAGVKYPWGPRRGSWPITCRCTEWSDLGMWGEQMWGMRLVLNEVRS